MTSHALGKKNQELDNTQVFGGKNIIRVFGYLIRKSHYLSQIIIRSFKWVKCKTL